MEMKPQNLSLLVSYEYKELNFPLFVVHILIQYSKPFTSKMYSIYKALVYTKMTHMATHILELHICKLTGFNLPSSLSFMVSSVST